MEAGAFEDFCIEFQEVIAGEKDLLQMIDKGRTLLSRLTSRTGWYREFLKKMVLDRDFLAGQKPAVWPNQVTLYRSPDRSFVVLSYMWDCYAADAIHDHGSWGIVGALSGTIGERKYERLDDGVNEGCAEVREKAFRSLLPGDTTHVLPLDQGIHRMENAFERIAVTINVYGKGIPRGYTQFFDPERKTVSRMYPPQAVREVLAIKTLGYMGDPSSEEILKEAIGDPQPEFIKRESRIALAKLKKDQSA